MAPTTDQLEAFAAAALVGLGSALTEPAFIAETIREQRHLWEMLYAAASGVPIEGPEVTVTSA